MSQARSLPDVLSSRVAANPDLPFVAMAGTPLLTVGDIESRSCCIANGLSGLGIGFGDRVMVMLPNCIEFIEAWFAINRIGAVIVTVNTAYRGIFLEHVADNSGARVMVVAEALLPAIAASERQLAKLDVLVVVRPQQDDLTVAPGGVRPGAVAEAEARPALSRLGIVEFDSLRDAGDAAVDVQVAPNDLSAIVYTSGTTGRSKGVMLPHAQMYMNPYIYLDQMGITDDDVMYAALPLFHTNALALQVYGALIAGCTVHVAAQFTASRWLADIRAARATVTNLLGVMTEFIYRQPPRPDDADNPLRIINAVPIAPALGRAFEKRFDVGLVELYGSTEANCPLYHPRDQPRRDGSCGKVLERWYQCRIADPDTDVEVPDGTVGELQIRPLTPGAFMAGYNAMPEETVKAWRNLWFHSGDAMRRDADGYYYFIDRINDCIRRRAENISSFEVEQVVLGHEAVAEAAAVGIRSPFDENDQEVKICVVTKRGAQLDAAALHQYCATRMPAFAVPRFIEFCEELPKTPTQKVRKQELRERGVTKDTWVAPDAGCARRGAQPAPAVRGATSSISS